MEHRDEFGLGGFVLVFHPPLLVLAGGGGRYFVVGQLALACFFRASNLEQCTDATFRDALAHRECLRLS